MDDPIGRVPDAPDPHVAVTVWTAQGVAPDAALVALAVGQRCNDLERALDDGLHLCQGLVKHVLDGGKRLGGLRVVPIPTLQIHEIRHTDFMLAFMDRKSLYLL